MNGVKAQGILICRLRAGISHSSCLKTRVKKAAIATHLLQWPKTQTPAPRMCVSFGAGRSADRCVGKVWQFLTKLTIPSNNHALCIYPKELEIDVHTQACPRLFITALFITANPWERPRCPVVGGWVSCGASTPGNMTVGSAQSSGTGD